MNIVFLTIWIVLGFSGFIQYIFITPNLSSKAFSPIIDTIMMFIHILTGPFSFIINYVIKNESN